MGSPKHLFIESLATKIGPLTLIADEEALVGLHFGDDAPHPAGRA